MDNSYCSVPQCNSLGSQIPRTSFHRFPSEKDESSKRLRQQWILKLRIGKKVTNQMVVCGKHFQPFDFFPQTYSNGPCHRTRLKKNAVPSKNLPVTPCQEKEEIRRKKTKSTIRSESKDTCRIRKERRKAEEAAAAEEANRLSGTRVEIKQEITDEWGESFINVAGSSSPVHVRLDIQVEKNKSEEWLERMNRNSSSTEILPTIAGTSSSNASSSNVPFHESTENDSQDIILDRRMIDLNFFLNQIRNLNCHSPFNCTFSDMCVTSEIREGRNTGLVFTCKKCKCEEIVWSENPKTETETFNDGAVIERMSIGEESSNVEDCPTNPEILSFSSNSSEIIQNKTDDVSRKTRVSGRKNATLEEELLSDDNEDIEAGGLMYTCRMCKHRETIRTENQKVKTVIVDKDAAMETMSTENSCNLEEHPSISKISRFSSNTNKFVHDESNVACPQMVDLKDKNAELEQNRLSVKNEEIEAGGLVFACRMCKHKETVRTVNHKIETVTSSKYTVMNTMSTGKECSNFDKCMTDSETPAPSSSTNKIAQHGINENCPKTVDLKRKNAEFGGKKLNVENEDVRGGSLVFTCKMCKHKETIWTEHQNTETRTINKTHVIETMNVDGEYPNSEGCTINSATPPLVSISSKIVPSEIKDSCQKTADLERNVNSVVSGEQSAMESGADGIPSSSDGC